MFETAGNVFTIVCGLSFLKPCIMIFSLIVYTIKGAKQMIETLNTLTILAASHAWEKGNSQLIIDVRTEGESKTGHLASATHLPLDIFEKNIVSLIKDKQHTVYLLLRKRQSFRKSTTDNAGFGLYQREKCWWSR